MTEPRRTRVRARTSRQTDYWEVLESELDAEEYAEYQNKVYAAGPLEDDYSEESEP